MPVRGQYTSTTPMRKLASLALYAVPKKGTILQVLHVPFNLVFLLMQVQMAVDVRFAQDTLRGDSVTEIRMKFIKRIEENVPAGDEWSVYLRDTSIFDLRDLQIYKLEWKPSTFDELNCI